MGDQKKKPDPKNLRPCATPGCEKQLKVGGKNDKCLGCRRKENEARKKAFEQEGGEGDKLEGLELSIERARDRGDPKVPLMLACLGIWSRGEFEDGSRVKNENVRMQAGKMLQNLIGGDVGDQEVRVTLIPDAYVYCSKCAAKMLADDRVSDDDVQRVFGGGK